MDVVVRFEYGSVVPWVRRLPDGDLEVLAAPDAVELASDIPARDEGAGIVGEAEAVPGRRLRSVLTWHEAHADPPPALDADAALERTRAVLARLVRPLDLPRRLARPGRALADHPEGAHLRAHGRHRGRAHHLAARGDRGCAQLGLPLLPAAGRRLHPHALSLAGHEGEAVAWRDWLVRAVAGDPSRIQVMYGTTGDRRLREEQLDWLLGYEGSRPVRIGNRAAHQFQLDVYGELADAMHLAREAGMRDDRRGWTIERSLLGFLEAAWEVPDSGIWEVRGRARHFTHSKAMAWAASTAP